MCEYQRRKTLKLHKKTRLFKKLCQPVENNNNTEGTEFFHRDTQRLGFK